MFNLISYQIKRSIIGFGLSLSILLFLVGCNSDDDNIVLEPTITSTNEILQNDWALVRVTGGIAGVDESYSIADSPETLTFRGDDIPFVVDVVTDSTVFSGLYSVQDVTSSNDTTFFNFGGVPANGEYFYLTGRRMFLIGSETLETELICCDQFDYKFVKL